MGTITPYSSAAGKRYRVRYRKPDGSQTDKRGFRRKVDAELFLASVEIAKSRGAYIDPSASRITLADWLETTARMRADLRPSSRDRLEGIIRRDIAPKLGGIALGDLSREVIAAWAAELSRDQGAASVRKIVGVLSGALREGVEAGRIATNPAARLKLPRVVRANKRYLSRTELHRLADQLEQHRAGWGLLVLVLGYCGLRWGELSGLRVRHVDVNRRRLEVRTTVVEVNGIQHESRPKSYEERSVPVPATIMRMLDAAIAGRDRDEPLFPSPRVGGHLRNRVFRRGGFDQSAREVGLEGLVPHELRHTAASLAVSAGANVLMVSRMLGHKSPKETLDTYAGLFEADVDQVAERLDEGLAATDVGKMWAKP